MAMEYDHNKVHTVPQTRFAIEISFSFGLFIELKIYTAFSEHGQIILVDQLDDYRCNVSFAQLKCTLISSNLRRCKIARSLYSSSNSVPRPIFDRMTTYEVRF